MPLTSKGRRHLFFCRKTILITVVFINFWHHCYHTNPNIGMSVLDYLWSVWNKWWKALGDNCIQNFHLERYIIWEEIYMRMNRAVKQDLWTYIWRYTSPTKIVNMVIPILMHQSFATTSPLGPGNSRVIDFFICKAQVKSLTLFWSNPC